MRFSLYGLDGEEYFTNWHTDSKEIRKLQAKAEDEARETVPKVTFAFKDFDGEGIEATTCIQEREWHKGIGCFKWLSLFTRPMISLSLDIQFNKETGKRKGSWKGGTIGHSIDMMPDELHKDAFRRYCAAHQMEFIE